MFETVAIVGATGAVGTIIRELLEQREFPCRRVKFLASGFKFSVSDQRRATILELVNRNEKLSYRLATFSGR